MKFLKWFLIVLVVAAFISVCSEEIGGDKETSTADNATTTENKAEQTQAEIAKTEPTKDYSSLVVPITQDSPKTYNAWGKKWIDDINNTMPVAINRIAKNDKCDEPVDVGLSIERSKPKEEAVFFVDCKNGERFYISQTELNNNAEVKAESEQLADAHEYIQMCKKAVKAQVNFPETFDEKTLSIHAYKGTSGNVVVEIPFVAKNAFGVEIENTGKCIIDTQNNATVEIF